jgi:glycosyltransferase involved in cell wall biosynthesis
VWHDKTVSVVLPTYNERDSIHRSIEDFFATGVVDEVLVVNNNAAPGTSEQVARTAAREIHEPKQGYGNAIQRGLRESVGEYIVICEPDGTFLARDIHKLLAFADDFDVVYGSRTARMFIWRGANMGLFLRWGNWAVAKMMEFLLNSTNLTDVGCTMRLISRSALQSMQPHFTIGGSAFGPEMMLISLIQGLRVIQIPVNYLPRVGESSVTGDPRKTVALGLWMIKLVWSYRIQSWRWPGRRRPAPARVQEASVHSDASQQRGRESS